MLDCSQFQFLRIGFHSSIVAPPDPAGVHILFVCILYSGFLYGRCPNRIAPKDSHVRRPGSRGRRGFDAAGGKAPIRRRRAAISGGRCLRRAICPGPGIGQNFQSIGIRQAVDAGCREGSGDRRRITAFRRRRLSGFGTSHRRCARAVHPQARFPGDLLSTPGVATASAGNRRPAPAGSRSPDRECHLW